MKYSIIIPAYNRAGMIARAIYSALNQGYADLEVIVVDDGSTDNTEEVVGLIKDARLVYYKKKNEERGAARNYGNLKATGDYVNFLDSDDVLYPNHIEEANKYIVKNNQPDIFYQAVEIPVLNSNAKVYERFNNGINEELIFGNPLPIMGVFMKRQVAIDNPFNEERVLAASEDWELWLRMAVKYPIPFNNVITSGFIQHDERSVLTFNIDHLIKSKEALISTVLSNKNITSKYGKKINAFVGSNYSYVALHLVLVKKNRALAAKYLFKSIGSYPRGIFTRRFLAVLKHMI